MSFCQPFCITPSDQKSCLKINTSLRNFIDNMCIIMVIIVSADGLTSNGARPSQAQWWHNTGSIYRTGVSNSLQSNSVDDAFLLIIYVISTCHISHTHVLQFGWSRKPVCLSCPFWPFSLAAAAQGACWGQCLWSPRLLCGSADCIHH